MFAFVPLIPFLALLLGYRRRGLPWRPSFLVAAIWWGTLVTVITEGLSLFRAVALPGMVGAWLAAGAATCLFAAGGSATLRPKLWSSFAGPEGVPEKWLLVPIAGIVACLGALGAGSAPNNYDSMTYHMSRVAHWIQNASVAHYPTHILRQIYQTPWAEYAVLQMQVTWGGDRFANLIQWFAMVGSVVGVSWIARQLGGGPRGQILAAALCATIPLGLLEATSTQNDYVLAFWLVCLAACVLAVVGDPRGETDRRWVIAGGAALGLALLTKGTGYLLAGPFLLWLGLVLWRRDRGRALAMGLMVGLVAVTMNAGYYRRNVELFGQPLGPGPGPGVPYVYTNAALSVGTTVSNAFRNLALEVGTPSWPVNVRIERAVRGVHRWLGLDADDPRSTFVGQRFIILAHLWNSENVAANLLHTLLAIATMGTVLASRASRRPLVVAFLVALMAGFGLLCAFVAWTPWNTRHLLPLLVLSCAAIGVVMERSWGRVLSTTVAVGLLVLSSAWVVNSAGHPLLGPVSVWRLPRRDQYFLRVPAFRQPFFQVASLARQQQCERIGLVTGWNDVEYPLWALLAEGASRPRIVHVNVDNVSARAAADGASPPCLVVSVDEQQHVRVEVRD